jgi:hypothetical protein
MAFETYSTKLAGIHRAITLLHEVRQMYTIGKDVQAVLALYIAGTDPALNAAINALFSAGERAELNTMLTQINALVSDWETNHAAAIGI